MYQLIEYLPLLVLGLLVLSTRSSHESNMRLLTKVEQERLYGEFTRYRLMQYGAIFGIIGILLPVLNGALEGTAGWALVGAAAVALGFYLTLGYRHLGERLQAIEMPEKFITAYLKDRYLIGILLGILAAQAGRRLLGL